MRFIDLEKFYSRVRPNVPMCPEPVIGQKLIDAAIELCEHAPVWRYEPELIAIRQGQSQYDIGVPHEHARVHSILGSWFSARKLAAASHHDLRDMRGTAVSVPIGSVSVYSVSMRGEVSVLGEPKADTDTVLRLSVSLKPSPDADELPESLYDDYLQTLVHGALGKLYEMNAQEWSNPDLSRRELRRFFQGKVQARMATDRGLVTGPQKLKRREFVSNRRYI